MSLKPHQYNEQQEDIRHELDKPIAWPLERFCTNQGTVIVRLRTSFFYWGALAAVVGGIALLKQQMMLGGALIITIAPCLILYPPVRFLFGGKGGLVPAITTAIIEEYTKHKIHEVANKRDRKR